jgi:Domain of unknown function (DUF4919)
MLMKNLLLATLIVIGLITTATAQTAVQTPTPSPNQSTAKPTHAYVQLVERAKKNDPTLSFKELRKAFADWLCDNKTDTPNREAMVEAFNKKDYAKAVELVEVVLDYEYVHRGLHLAAEDAYRHLGNTTKADEHKAVAEKLLDALLTSGDGKTAATAFFVLSIREEYFIMDKLGYKTSSQALVQEGNGMFDVLSGTDTKTGNSVSLYFDIGSFFGGCDRKKQPKP